MNSFDTAFDEGLQMSLYILKAWSIIGVMAIFFGIGWMLG